MSASSTSLRGARARRATPPNQGLRRLRRTFLALAAVFAILLPFEQGTLQAPDLSAIDLAALPYVGQFFPQPPAGVLRNSLRTVLVEQSEHFSVRLPGLPHAMLTYVLRYPNGHEIRAMVQADALGYASYTFPITYRPHHFREVATIQVLDATGRVRASTRFAIQLPDAK